MATFEPSPDLDPAVAQAIQDAMDALRAELLGHLASSQEPAAPAPELGSAGGDRLARLELAVEALDAADTQPALLGSLLEEAGAFAERTMFMVREGEELTGWAAFGFADGGRRVEQVAVEVAAEIVAGRPVDEPAAAAGIVDQMMASKPAASLMVPFALRGNVVGALYADARSGADGLDRPALRILAYVAAQALETIPLRQRAGSAGVEAPQSAVPEREVERPEIEEPEIEELEVEEPEVGEPEAAQVEEEAAPIEEPVEALAEAEARAEADSSPSKDFDFVPDAAYESEPETADLEADVDKLIQEVELERDVEVGDPDIVAIRHEVTPPEFEPADEGLEESAFDTAVDDVAAATQEMSTVETDIEEAPMRPPAPARTIEASEVAPPDDLDGPGWAFTGSGSISDDTRHEEARRLARLLVTEIKLYNEEKVRQGRENNDVYDQLRDDIERSRRIYEERIDNEVREDADYFHEEVVRILAGGDSTALGI